MPEDLYTWPYIPSNFPHLHHGKEITMQYDCITGTFGNLLIRYLVFKGDIQKSPIASHLKTLDSSFVLLLVSGSHVHKNEYEHAHQLYFRSKLDNLVLSYELQLWKSCCYLCIPGKDFCFGPPLQIIDPRYSKFSTAFSLPPSRTWIPWATNSSE